MNNGTSRDDISTTTTTTTTTQKTTQPSGQGTASAAKQNAPQETGSATGNRGLQTTAEEAAQKTTGSTTLPTSTRASETSQSSTQASGDDSCRTFRIGRSFDGSKGFIPFVTCGDPDLETTKQIVCALADAGATIIELGIPFSDPTAEGPVIQEANIRSLSAGTTTDAIFETVADLREEVDVPLAFMTYANVVFHYGTDRFCEHAARAGVDALILPDVPFEEREEFVPACNANGLDYISLIAPTSEERVAMIAREAQGFVYCVSSLGVTGTRSEITTDLDTLVARIRKATDIPVAIGFGISNPEQARAMAQKSNGAIVGSALVKIIAEYGRDAAPYVGEAAQAMVDAIRA